jgi:hypothetical protein
MMVVWVVWEKREIRVEKERLRSEDGEDYSNVMGVRGEDARVKEEQGRVRKMVENKGQEQEKKDNGTAGGDGE